MLEIKAQGAKKFAGQRLLDPGRHGLRRRRGRRLPGQDPIQQARQKFGQSVKMAVDVRRAQARFVLRQQGIVGRTAEGLGLGRGRLANQGDHRFQIGA